VNKKEEVYFGNIMKVIDGSYDHEISEGLSFYDNWHSLARLLYILFDLRSVEHGAGILAALSPRNFELDNISHAFQLCRTGTREGIRNTDRNVSKALSILKGGHPEIILGGRKVRAFYQAIAAPNLGMAIPVDRHLCCAAIGNYVGDREVTKTLAKDYSSIESVFFEIGSRSGIPGIKASAVAWLTWRRLKRTGYQSRIEE
jgi:hypothetical protein